MFVLVEMVDTVRIPPWNFERQLNDAIAEELNKKLANKVREVEPMREHQEKFILQRTAAANRRH